MDSSEGCGEAIVMKAHLPGVAILHTHHSLQWSKVNRLFILNSLNRVSTILTCDGHFLALHGVAEGKKRRNDKVLEPDGA